MAVWRSRSLEHEKMDGPISDFNVLANNLKEIEWINRFTGGPELGFRQILKLVNGRTESLHIADIGFGGGDMLRYLLKYKSSFSAKIKLSGIDLMPESLQFIEKFYPSMIPEIDFQIMDYQDWFKSGNQPDIIYAGLFCHHLDDSGILKFLTFCKKAKVGAVINDLHRHPLPYGFIKAATQLFSGSEFTRHDAPLSVLRGFTAQEWKGYLDEAGIKKYTIQWKWAFRHLITIYHE